MIKETTAANQIKQHKIERSFPTARLFFILFDLNVLCVCVFDFFPEYFPRDKVVHRLQEDSNLITAN